MPSCPIHEFELTGLWTSSFGALVAEQYAGEDDVLLVASSGEEATQVKHEFLEALDSDSPGLEIYTGDQCALPYDGDRFGAAIHANPSRGVLQRHRPFYEVVDAVAPGGTIVFRAPNYLVESDAVALEELYSIGWRPGTSHKPSAAAVYTVTESASMNPAKQGVGDGGPTLSTFTGGGDS